MLKMVIPIAAGGAVGAVARYLIMVAIGHAVHVSFPVSTLIVNVVGCFVLGLLIEVSALAWSIGGELRAFLVVGVLGGFTTFSAFAMEAVLLGERGQILTAGTYVILSVVLSIAALFLGMVALRAILT